MSNNAIIFHTLSDAVGAAGNTIIKEILTQFPDITYDIHETHFIKHETQLDRTLKNLDKEKTLVILSFINRELNLTATQYCRKNKLHYIDIITPFFNHLYDLTNQSPIESITASYQIDDDYYQRIEAIEFAVTHDDGQSPRGLLEADIVLLGISRTSKTPLSIYLANMKYKVANLPLLPEAHLPEELWRVNPDRIIGLTNDRYILQFVRQERMISYDMNPDSFYASQERIDKELNYAYDLYKQLGCLTINVANKSIEETATIILNQLETL